MKQKITRHKEFLMVRKYNQYTRFLLKTKGIIGLAYRIGMLQQRFDLSGNNMKKVILEIDQLGKEYHYKPTLVVPAVVLKRYQHFFTHLAKDNLEFAIHGYSHKNYKLLSLEEQISSIKRAKEVFKELNINCYGFRAPYLSWNDNTVSAVQHSNLVWESDKTIIWNGTIESHKIKINRFHQKAIHFLYNPYDAKKNISIPRLVGNVVRIPILLPDDEILIDRLGCKNSERIEEIWSEMYEGICKRGEIFVLQLHPERFQFCKYAMKNLLNKASKQDVWITSMKDVSEWWKEKNYFKFTFQKHSQKGYRIHCKCTDRATVLCRNIGKQSTESFFYKDYRHVKGREFFIQSSKKPCVGVNSKCSKKVVQFLRNEGFHTETSDEDLDYSIFLEGYETFDHHDELELLKTIENNPNPVIRYWRWPDEKKSALLTTHDLDSLTIQDFVYRIFEN